MSAHERTEEATPKRRLTARAAGHVPRSMLASPAAALLIAPVVVAVLWHWLLTWLRAWQTTIAQLRDVAVGHADAETYLRRAWVVLGRSSALHACGLWWLGACGAAIAGAAASGALRPMPGAVSPRLERLARGGWRALVSPGHAAQVALAAIGCTLLVGLAVPDMMACLRAAAGATLNLDAALTAFWEAAKALWVRAAAAVGAVAVVDVVLARRRYAAQLRMTPWEVREERAETETRPEVKSRRRAAASRHARDVRIAAVRRATAVVVNPRHVAVALRYAPPAVDVPRVVARGAELSALLVRAAAAAYDVPVIEAPELARLLYATTAVDDPIPETCYAAVAAVFAWIVRTGGRLRRGDEDEA